MADYVKNDVRDIRDLDIKIDPREEEQAQDVNYFAYKQEFNTFYTLQAFVTDDGKNCVVKSGVRTAYEKPFKYASFFPGEFKTYISALLSLDDSMLNTSPAWALHGRRGRYVKRSAFSDVSWF